MKKYTFVKFLILLFILLGIINWYKNKSAKNLSFAYNLKELKSKKSIIPIAVIGSGPAGLSAALYGARASIYTVVFEGKKPGGQLTETTYVENWPGTKKMLGSELIDQNRLQAQKFGAIMVNDSIECVDFSSWPYRLQTEEGHEIYALSVIITTGSNPKLLNVPGEKEYWGYGVTTCAVCDAPFYKEKQVVVIGGGDSAVEEATLLASYAKEVLMLVRGSAMRAAPAMQKRIESYNNIKVLYNTQITKIIGDNKNVTQIELKNNKNNSINTIDMDGVFLAIGHDPNSEIFKKFIKTDELGYIILEKETRQTSLPGIFAAGDVCDHRYRQAGCAAGDGIKAALDAINFLQEIGINDEVLKSLDSNFYDSDKSEQIEKFDHLITNKDLEELSKKHKDIIIEVGATYCPSCKILLSNLKSTAHKFKDKVGFAQIELDDNPKPTELIEKFNLTKIPVLLIIQDGKLAKKYENKVFTKHELYLLINSLLVKD